MFLTFSMFLPGFLSDLCQMQRFFCGKNLPIFPDCLDQNPFDLRQNTTKLGIRPMYEKIERSCKVELILYSLNT